MCYYALLLTRKLKPSSSDLPGKHLADRTISLAAEFFFPQSPPIHYCSWQPRRTPPAFHLDFREDECEEEGNVAFLQRGRCCCLSLCLIGPSLGLCVRGKRWRGLTILSQLIPRPASTDHTALWTLPFLKPGNLLPCDHLPHSGLHGWETILVRPLLLCGVGDQCPTSHSPALLRHISTFGASAQED